MRTVVFACVRNAGRSQMAAALLGRHTDGHVRVRSAGSQPARGIHPVVTRVMREIGVDLAAQAPRAWTNDLLRGADVVVTLGCGEDCPRFPDVRYEDWPVPDPELLPAPEVRLIRDDLDQRVRQLIAELVGPAAASR